MTGILVRKLQEKGFGFIKNEQGNEYFLHYSECVRPTRFDDLVEGDTIEFEPKDSPKGLRASKAQKV